MRTALSALAALLLFLVAPLAAQDQPAYQPAPEAKLKPFDIGISAGMVLPGTIDIEGVKIVSAMSPYFKVHFDAYIVEKLAMGVYASYLMISMDHTKVGGVHIPDSMNGASGYEIGGTIKPVFKLNEQLTLKPGLDIAYRYISPDYFDEEEGTGVSGFALGATVALKFKAGSFSPFIAPGFISQPAGGNDYADVTWPPIFTVAGGIEF